MKKAIHQIAADVLAEEKRPMTSEELYELIVSRNLYEFKAKNPKSVLKSQLRRHSENVSGAKQSGSPLFTLETDGKFKLK